MKWAGVAAFALAALGVPACAAGYDDFTLGMTANLRHDYAGAVTAFTKALSAPDLVATYKSAAYRGRAEAYLNLETCDKAKTDLQSYETLKTADRSVVGLRIWVELCLKDNAAARKDLDFVGKGKLGAADLWVFARLQWRYDLFDESMASGREAFKAVDKKTKFASWVLVWLAVAEQRAGKFDAAEISAGLAETKLDEWPKPLLELYLGKRTPQSVAEEAKSWRQSKEDAQRCEANFYTAEWHLGHGDKPAAIPLFQEVVKSCPIDFIELPAAKSELKRLGVPVPKE